MITTQPFGRTGHNSTRIIFGGAALGGATQDEANRVLDMLLQHGINHIDTAASYGDSELRIGPWMEQHRDKFFLATKTGERTYQKAKDQIERSLERLRVNQIDLLQLHNLADVIEWQTALGPGGALEAAVEARQAGKIKFIGVTGHGLSIAAMHLRSLGAFDFDSVLLPYNWVTYQNQKYSADFEAVLQECQKRSVAVQTIKAIARRPWGLQQEHNYTTWYEPLTEQDDIDRAVGWVLSRPGIFLNTASDIGLLAKILDAAERLPQQKAAPTDADLAGQAARLEQASLFV